MLSNKPYLTRAFYDWIVDSACTPYINVNAVFPQCKVPQQFVDENGQITLNLSPSAVRDLKISNEILEFRASFSGIVHFMSIPIPAILAIYAQENGQGMFFDFEDEVLSSSAEDGGWEGNQSASDSAASSQDKKVTSHLKLVE